MKLDAKSPFWKWREVVEWLFTNKVMENITEERVKNALFLETINIVLEERDTVVSETRNRLIKKFEEMGNLKKSQAANQRNLYS